MWRLTTSDGRVAWFCADDPDLAHAMAAELFPDDRGVRIEPAGEDESP